MMTDSTRESAYEAALAALIERVRETRAEVGTEFPLYADPETGEWVTTSDGDWCGGHWIGLLWLATKYVDDADERATMRETAYARTETVLHELPAETMFRGCNLLYAGFRGYDVTGDRKLFGLGLAGADDVRAHFDERARQVPLGEFQIRGPDNFRGEPSGDDPGGDVIGAVDSIYTSLPVLWRAFAETRTPVFRDTAVSHADRHLDWFVRSDGSTWHHAEFDPESGSLLRQYNELAQSDETCWARGQGWNIAGLARAYGETGAERYLHALEQTTRYYVEHAPPDLVPRWDLAVSDPDEPRDTSSAALAAYGLARLRGPDQRVARLRRSGREILDSLVHSYLVTDPDDPRYGMLFQGCYNRPGEFATDNELIWSDYYLAYTLDALLGR